MTKNQNSNNAALAGGLAALLGGCSLTAVIFVINNDISNWFIFIPILTALIGVAFFGYHLRKSR